jgi:feruloyl esterase
VPDKTANRPLNKIYSDWVDVNHALIFPHLAYGSEAQWGMALTTADESSPSGIDYARYFLYNDPTWPWQALDYSTTQPADKLDPDNATANNFDLTPFHARGGKLIHHHGLADSSIAMGSGIHFYNQVLRLLKPKGVDLDAFYRFFLVPGMQN